MAAKGYGSKPKSDLHRDAPTHDRPAISGDVPAPALDLICIADVQAQKTQWHWTGRIPKGATTLFVGNPGVGKTFVTHYITARCTKGLPLPDDDGSVEPGEVIIMSCEDSLAQTIRPRLDAAGADVSKVFFIRGVQETDPETGKKYERSVRLDIDIERIKSLLEQRPQVRLVVIDPISEYLGKTDSHKNAEVRSILSPLSALAGCGRGIRTSPAVP
jgi:RecA-family ATPase